jgi:hypothetical protein
VFVPTSPQLAQRLAAGSASCDNRGGYCDPHFPFAFSSSSRELRRFELPRPGVLTGDREVLRLQPAAEPLFKATNTKLAFPCRVCLQPKRIMNHVPFIRLVGTKARFFFAI